MDIIRLMLLTLPSRDALEAFLRENQEELLTDEIEARHERTMKTCGREIREGLERQLQLIRDCRRLGIAAGLEIFWQTHAEK